MDLLDEIAEHFLGDVEVGDDAVFHGADSNNAARGAAEHLLGLLADGENLPLPHAVLLHRHHGRFADDDALAFQVNEGIGGSQVDGKIIGKHPPDGIK